LTLNPVEAAADVGRDEAQSVDTYAERGGHPDRADARHLVVAMDRPLLRAPVVLDERARAFERRGREAMEMELLDRDEMVGLRLRGLPVAPVEDTRPDDVRRSVLVEHDLVLQRLLRVYEHGKRLVLDLDQLGRVSCELARRRTHRCDGLAHVPHLADRERVVLDLVARRHRHLEEGVGLNCDLVAGDRPVDTVQRECPRHVDRDDLRVRVRRAHEVHVAHSVPAHVVEEETLALHEPPVLLAWDGLADEALLQLGRLLAGDGRRAPHVSPTL
jgi:hypothetical protein